MRPKDAYETFEQTLTYPIDHETVVDQLGETTVESPNGTERTIAEILERADTDTYASYRELCDAFACYLDDGFIGRKFYDDRGDNVLTDQPQ